MRHDDIHVVDAHIHVDGYKLDAAAELEEALADPSLEYVIAVSMNLASCHHTEQWAKRYPNKVLPAYGFHPEQALPSDEEQEVLLAWLDGHKESMAAIGEVGLPYYMREEALKRGGSFDRSPYIELLEPFVKRAAAWDMPIVLHAVYDDAPIVVDLLERFSVRRAHFHWFKGDNKTIDRMAGNGYFISFTPDICYEDEIRALARQYPLEQAMTETDGPWPFEGPYDGRRTLPTMARDVALEWAVLRGMDVREAAKLLRENAKRCYGV
ncbi:TatD family hydrolase [Paenibacillus alvei]|uniref:TatD family hydrolase n=1 Tax=Paenibacillus alvei TaxID=44250 RepID=UPI0018CFB13C|nr:TatD family hydrolase [Paenibacillus alvei]MBG9735164.1 DNAase [Paenibacillus alvei]MBG9743622.1 DNAase [Paenibacillus alvei]MCY9580026.1 TatD family hydrolase [Paenibacillus alvei]MCY9584202.1 TatD family hydrolase [Paenibacillus alvei]